MFRNPAEIAGWAIAVIVVVIMGVIALHKPFNISKASATSSYQTGQKMPALHVSIMTDPKTIGRYVPSTIRVHIGQTVIFSNTSNAPHTVTNQASTAAFDSQNIGLGANWPYIPAKAGTYRYICLYHPLMLGEIVVYG